MCQKSIGKLFLPSIKPILSLLQKQEVEFGYDPKYIILSIGFIKEKWVLWLGFAVTEMSAELETEPKPSACSMVWSSSIKQLVHFPLLIIWFQHTVSGTAALCTFCVIAQHASEALLNFTLKFLTSTPPVYT